MSYNDFKFVCLKHLPFLALFMYSFKDSVKMFSAQNKIKKDKNAEPTECDVQVAQVTKNDSSYILVCK